MAKLTLRLRQEAEDGLTTVWLIAGSTALSGLMHGVLMNGVADDLAEQLEGMGIAVEREQCPYKYAGEPRPKTVAAKQAEHVRQPVQRYRRVRRRP